MTTHGMTGAPEFHSWEGMWQRCTNRNHVFFKDYGGRGITVDPRWEKFENSMKTWGRALQERHLTGKTRSTAITGRGYASGAHIENKQTRGVCVWPLLLMVRAPSNPSRLFEGLPRLITSLPAPPTTLYAVPAAVL